MSVSAAERARVRWHAADMDYELLNNFATFQRSQSIAETTIRNRAWLLHGFQRFAGVPLLHAGLTELREYLAREGVKPGTKRTERGALQAFYRWALEDGYIEVDPTAKLKPVRVPRAEARPFMRWHIEAMLSSGAYHRTRVMILLGHLQGFRVSQIARVRGDDIDTKAMMIRTVAKGGKVRRMPLHPLIAQIAEDMPADWWFPARDGRDAPILAASVTDLISSAKRRAGITDPTLTPHSLWHAFGCELSDAEVDIRVIQELLLHEQLSTTQLYTRVSDRRKTAGLAHLRPVAVPLRSGRSAA